MSNQRKSGAKKKAMRKSGASNELTLVERAPSAKRLTAYDEAHLITYLRLLDANASGERGTGLLQIVLDDNPALSQLQAGRAVASHLKRALWISATGYRQFLGKAR